MTEDNQHYTKTFPISWEQLHRDSRALAWRLLDRNDYFKGIVAITRGGLVPAAIIAPIPNITTVPGTNSPTTRKDSSAAGACPWPWPR